MEHHLNWFIIHFGYAGIFLALALGIVGLPIPDEILLTYIGYNVFQGSLHFLLSLLSACAGASTGITVSYFIGNKLGLPFLRKVGPKLHITDKRIERTNGLFQTFGPYLLLVGYFIPGVRHLTAYMAGMSGMEFRRFAPFAYCGAFIWSTTFLLLGFGLGEKWYLVKAYIHRYGLYVFSLLALIVITVLVISKWKQIRQTRDRTD